MKLSASVSTGREAHDHDIRKTLKRNVTPELSKDNVILIDNLQDQKPDDYINGLMQPYIDEYNAKQKRKDRKINKTYIEYHKNNKNLEKTKFFYEMVCQVGEHNDLGKRYYEAQGEERAQIRQEFIDTYTDLVKMFQEKYPNLKIGWATLHFDEEAGTPHMHLCVTPIGEGYKKGLNYQISIGKALSNCGVERLESKKEAQELGGYQLIKFYKQVQDYMEQEYIIKRGHEVKPHEKGKKHQTLEEWEALQSLQQQNQEQKQALEAATRAVEQQKEKKRQIIQEQEKIVSEAKQKAENAQYDQMFAEWETQDATKALEALKEENNQVIKEHEKNVSEALQRAENAKQEQQKAEQRLQETKEQEIQIREKAQADAQIEVKALKREIEEKDKQLSAKDKIIDSLQKEVSRLKNSLLIVKNFMIENNFYNKFMDFIHPERKQQQGKDELER